MKSDLQEAMSINLITTKLNEKMEDAYTVMRSNNIRHLPVLNRQGDVVGIISDRDFQRAMRSDSPEVVDFGYNAIVSDFMNFPVQTVTYDTQLSVVIRKMIDDKISSMLITADGSIIGIISHEDLLKILEQKLLPVSETVTNKLSKWISTSPIGDVFRSLSGIGI